MVIIWKAKIIYLQELVTDLLEIVLILLNQLDNCGLFHEELLLT